MKVEEIMQTETQSVWNNLEIAKLIVSAITPIVVGILVWKLNEAIKRFEHRQWRNQKLIEKRLEIYERLAPKLNDLLCYFTYIGCWKELTPEDVVKMKRVIDKEIYLAQPLFSRSFYSACMNFMNSCYETYKGFGKDATLRTKFQRRKEISNEWKSSWEEMFSKDEKDENHNDKITNPKEIQKAYIRLMNSFSEEIGFVEPREDLSLGRVSSNIK